MRIANYAELILFHFLGKRVDGQSFIRELVLRLIENVVILVYGDVTVAGAHLSFVLALLRHRLLVIVRSMPFNA